MLARVKNFSLAFNICFLDSLDWLCIGLCINTVKQSADVVTRHHSCFKKLVKVFVYQSKRGLSDCVQVCANCTVLYKR